MLESDQVSNQLPFGDPIYIISAILDPACCLFWINHDVLVKDGVEEKVKKQYSTKVLYVHY